MITYTDKRSGTIYNHVSLTEDGKFELSNDNGDNKVVSQSTLDRWYKKEIVVDFPATEEEPEQKAEEKASPKAKAAKKPSKKESKPRAKSYEEQNWGLCHSRTDVEDLCQTMGFDSVEYDSKTQTILLYVGPEVTARRRAWENEVTGNVWFRYKNAEYELTDIEYGVGL